MLPKFCYHIHHKFALSINKLAACYLYYNVTYTLMPKGVEFDTAVCFLYFATTYTSAECRSL